MARFRVLVTDYAWPDLTVEEQVLARADAELIVADPDDDTLIKQAAGVDGILTCWRQVPVGAIEAAPNCRIVSRYGIGLDNIPVQQATVLGIIVSNVPDYCLDEVSDHTMALLLACARRIVPFAVGSAHGEWKLDAGRTMQRLRGQTLGLIGYGNVARLVGAKAQAFGLHVLAYTPNLRGERLADGVTVARTLTELLEHSDYVSLHVPLTGETRGMVDGAVLRQMKPTAFLINTARGAVVDEAALRTALHEGWIAGAAIDVVADEPPAPDHPLLALENLIATPHAAFYSLDAIQELTQRAAEHVASALRGEIPPIVVNQSVLEQANLRLLRDAPGR